jgi:hypothetical protein
MIFKLVTIGAIGFPIIVVCLLFINHIIKDEIKECKVGNNL